MSLEILIVNPAPPDSRKGNNVTARRWRRRLVSLGHQVAIENRFTSQECDILLALHAKKSADSIERFAATHPDKPIILALTGTDLYRDLPGNEEARASLDRADRLVVLQQEALDRLDESQRNKTHVIFQSVDSLPDDTRRPDGEETFVALMVAHLRPVKDPITLIEAVGDLPESSRTHAYHIGGVLREDFGRDVRARVRRTERFSLLGEMSREETLKYMQGADLIVIPSRLEGGANVLTEAIACQTPVLASDIAGNHGLLGDYTGYFPVGDEDRLRKQLVKTERKNDFYNDLKRQIGELRDLTNPERERASWEDLIASL